MTDPREDHPYRLTKRDACCRSVDFGQSVTFPARSFANGSSPLRPFAFCIARPRLVSHIALADNQRQRNATDKCAPITNFVTKSEFEALRREHADDILCTT